MKIEGEPQGVTESEALTILEVIKGQIYQEGAVDAEPAMLENIRAKLLSGEISPREAIEKAQAIAAGRQSYH